MESDRRGSVDPAQAAAALRPDTVLVSMMLVNNELGSLLPVRETVQAVKRTGCPASWKEAAPSRVAAAKAAICAVASVPDR